MQVCTQAGMQACTQAGMQAGFYQRDHFNVSRIFEGIYQPPLLQAIFGPRGPHGRSGVGRVRLHVSPAVQTAPSRPLSPMEPAPMDPPPLQFMERAAVQQRHPIRSRACRATSFTQLSIRHHNRDGVQYLLCYIGRSLYPPPSRRFSCQQVCHAESIAFHETPQTNA